MNPAEDRYTVKLVFRGLCLARRRREEERLDVFLPDATSVPPKGADEKVWAEVHAAAAPFREHHAVLEMCAADWENPSRATPRLVHVEKPTKEPVALYLLKGERLSLHPLFGTRAEQLTGPAEAELIAKPGRYSKLGKLRLLEQDDAHGLDQLPRFASDLAAAPEKHCRAMVELDVGEVYSERRSMDGRAELRWRDLPALASKQPRVKDPKEPGRTLNLDLVVRLSLPRWNPLLVTCEPIANGLARDRRSFILRPRAPGDGVTLWVKNRELSAILQDSDALPDPFGSDCAHNEDLDRDHALMLALASEQKAVNVQWRQGGSASDCGSGCGCTDGGGG